MKILVGGDTIDGKLLVAASDASGIEVMDVEVVARSSAALLWEFSKAGTAESSTISAVMSQLGLPSQLGDAFAQVRFVELFDFEYAFS